MNRKFFRTAVLFALCCFFPGCSLPQTEVNFDGEKSKLSAQAFEKIDYKVRDFKEAAPGGWHKSQFQTLWSRGYEVKRNTSLPEARDTFPRYTVIEEVYESENSAAARLKRIREKPPSEQNEEYWIVTGFQHGKNVYFIQTDSVMFGYYMDDFAAQLAGEIKK